MQSLIQKQTVDKEQQFINYTTKANDNLHTICRQFHSNPYRIRQLNPNENLDEIQGGHVLLIEINSSLKSNKNETETSIQQFRKSNLPDMTFMKKPQFIQITPVGYKFKDRDLEEKMDEFQKLNDNDKDFTQFNFEVQANYLTTAGYVPGLLKLSFKTITFIPNLEKLNEIIIENTIRRDKEITEEVIEGYNFNLLMEDVYVFRISKLNPQVIQIYLFGVLGVELPLKDSFDNIALIEVNLMITEKLTKSKIKYLQEFHATEILTINTDLNGNKLLTQVISDILCSDSYCQNTHIYLTVMQNAIMNEKLKSISQNGELIKTQSNINMKCLSIVKYYELINFKLVESNQDRRTVIDRYKNKTIPKLKSDTEIMEFIQFEYLFKQLPFYLSQNDWILMYSPTKHGTSLNEFFRRCGSIGPHYLIIRDEQDVVFGAYLPQSWIRMGEVNIYLSQIIYKKYYGDGESFVFSFSKKKCEVFHWTKRNNAFQMANEYGLFIGADERPAISINNDLLYGSSFPCETFGNSVLANDYSFKIINLEIWGLSDSCEVLLRTLRQSQSAYFGNDF